MIIREIRPVEKEKFLTLANKHDNIFLDLKWLDTFPFSFKLFGIFGKKSDDLIGGFCCYRTTKYGIPILQEPPFTPHISLFYINRTPNKANRNSFQKKVYTALADFLNGKKFHLVNVSLPPQDIDMQPFIWKKFRIKPRYTYQIDLTQDEKLIYSSFSPERRNDVSKAVKDDVTVKLVFEYDELKYLVGKTFENNNIKNLSKLADSIFDNFATPDNSIALVAYQSNRPIACSFVVYNSKIAYYILGGYDRKNRHHGAGALCIWEAIKATKERNVNVFDFEGSMIPSIESFFRGFGGELVPFFQVRKYPLSI